MDESLEQELLGLLAKYNITENNMKLPALYKPGSGYPVVNHAVQK